MCDVGVAVLVRHWKPWTRAEFLNMNPRVILSPSSDQLHQLKSKGDNRNPFAFCWCALPMAEVRCECGCRCESGSGLGVGEGAGVVPLGPEKEDPVSELTYMRVVRLLH